MRASLLLVAALALNACAPAEPPPTEDAEVEKIPITTFSEAARELYLEGRRMTDRLRFNEARERYQEALDKDPTFALAHLALANSARSTQDFFDSLAAAVVHADRTSEGERHMILAQDAAVRGEPDAQEEHLTALIELFPDDERGYFLLAGFDNGRQEFEAAVGHYRRAIAINPDFSSAYNSLGYTLRALRRYEEAEEAFLKYIELIPGEPNPYDSYAELLMKIGRFEESMTTYRRALAIDPHFVFSFVGIGHNQIFLGDGAAARATFQELFEAARDDGERRTARFWTAASWVHEGDHDRARAELEAMAAIAGAAGDTAGMSGDFNSIGDVELDRGDAAAARAAFERAVELMENAAVNEDVKRGTRRNGLWQRGRAALLAGDVADAKALVAEYRELVEERSVPFEVRRVHQLEGQIALAEGDPERAVDSLEGAGRQNPRVLYLLARAQAEAGRDDEAVALAERVVDFNQISAVLAFVRDDAERLLAELAAADPSGS